MFSHSPLVLDFDKSVDTLPNEHRIDLTNWQETIRFGCRHKQFKQLSNHLTPLLPKQYGCVFMGSGDYHHITQLLLRHLSHPTPFELIVCDNHPDNMIYPFGIHCGSWVYWASKLPYIKAIHVLGICSSDISAKHAWENHLSPLRKRKLTYWNINVNTQWLRWIGATNSAHTFTDPDTLLHTFLAQLSPNTPLYLSIDKDVLSKQVIQTNWDQGQFLEHHLTQLINACQGRLIGADINGEVSNYQYQSRFKRFLSACDEQETITPTQVTEWQITQNELNHRLLTHINTAFTKD